MKQDINTKYKEFISLLNFSKGKYGIVDVFKDFVIIYAIAIKNKFHYEQNDENIYFNTIKKYKKSELDIFLALFEELQKLYMKESEIRDVLGEIYFQIGAIRKDNRQFFSPKEVGVVNALIVREHLSKENKEFDVIYDPTCGSGTLLLYYANVLMCENLDYTKKAFYWGQDIDFVCFCMSYIQMSLYGMSALVVWGDTLALQTNKIFYTPEFFIGNWKAKIEKRKEKLEYEERKKNSQ